MASCFPKSFKPGRPIGGDFYLRSLIKCPECGNNMVCRRTYYKTKKSKERTIKRYYICSLFNRSGSSACHSNAINAEVVERVSYLISVWLLCFCFSSSITFDAICLITLG